MLAFEPPYFGPDATFGGCIAAGFSGPRRACAGSARDFVLGVRIINGLGEELRFGGKVMKNVAGYDLSRLLAGSFGTLGLLTEVSVKVLPLPREERTLRLTLDEAAAIESMNNWAAKPLSISATCHVDGSLYVRLSGAAAGHGFTEETRRRPRRSRRVLEVDPRTNPPALQRRAGFVAFLDQADRRTARPRYTTDRMERRLRWMRRISIRRGFRSAHSAGGRPCSSTTSVTASSNFRRTACRAQETEARLRSPRRPRPRRIHADFENLHLDAKARDAKVVWKPKSDDQNMGSIYGSRLTER
jgi:FAD/FMN-containing dehydrogenase